MAISRILGASLVSNLDREGVDLQFTTLGNALVYMDFANFRFGINTNTPNQSLEVNGNVLVANGSVLSWANVSSDIGDTTNWYRTVYANTLQSSYLYGTLQTTAQPNITSVGDLTSLTVLGNIVAGNITTSGTIGITGNLTVDDIIANTVSATIVTADQPYIANLANIQVDSLTTLGNVSASAVVTDVIESTDVYGTIQTTDQPYISNLGNITVDSITIGGNITITGNTTGGVIYADEIYDGGYRVLTSNTNLVVTGDATGSGTYANIAITLADTGVVAGIYGAADDEYVDRVPKITVDSKGRIINISNVALTQIGNVSVMDTTISTVGNITIAPDSGYILANNSVISDVADPVSNQDVVTLSYLTTQLTSAANVLTAGDSKIEIVDTGSLGQIDITVDGNIVANITGSTTSFNTSVVIGNLTIADRTISSDGNIVIDAQNAGIVQIAGSDALGIPAGNVASRPTIAEPGYFRFNTDSNVIEVYDGNTWVVPGAATVTSEIISPDGSSNVFTLTSNATTDGVLVSINGTMQQPLTAYSVVGNQIAFTEIPSATDVIEVRHIGSSTVTVASLAYGATYVGLDLANVNITGNLLPSANVIYDIGSDSLRWRDLYLSGNTINLGGATISAINGELNFTPSGGSPISLSSDVDPSILFDNGNNVKVSSNHINVAIAGTNVASFSATGLVIDGNITTTGILNGNLAVTNLTGTLEINQGGTGATTNADALNNLLPSGEQTGYVLTTGGAGTYYWAAGSGGGGATVGQQLTTLRQSNTATAGQTVFGLADISYTPGTGQLRVYINGVRQHPDAYTETDSTSYTLSQGVNEGTAVFAEIDAFSSFNNYANLTYASNIGNISASGLTVQSAIDTLETTKAPLASPVFSGYVKIQNPLEITEGGTGATTNADALNNLLPSGEQSGYVLKTSGPGTYYWASESGGGGATVGQELTTLRQANVISGNTTVITLDGIEYTPGTGQLRVFVNGVRQFPSAYTETSNVSYTLSANVTTGDTVFTEIDAFSSFNNYANLTYASNVGNVNAVGLTVQSAIENLENNKAPLASPVFTGTPSIDGVSIGFKELPQLTTSNVTLALTDSGKHFYLSSAGTYWYQVPSNANVAFPVGTTIVIVNKTTGNITANTQAEVSMYLAGNVTASNRTITAYGMATLIKTATNEWFINGTGVV